MWQTDGGDMNSTRRGDTAKRGTANTYTLVELAAK